MLQVRSSLDVADNTGAKIVWNIGVLGKKTRRMPASAMSSKSMSRLPPRRFGEKGEVHDAVVVRTRQIIPRADGSYLRFDRNACVIIDKEMNPEGVRVSSAP